jgi:hypothetical protein
MIVKNKTEEQQEKKKNPVWDKLFQDERMSGIINKDLPEFLKIAIEHEIRCVKYRLKQIEGYLDRMTLLESGVDYFDTFQKIPSRKGVPFPKTLYLIKKEEWEKLNKKNKTKGE